MTEAGYTAWNGALSQRFLQHAGPQPLYLFTDRSVIEEVASEAGVVSGDAMGHFAQSVTSTLTWREPFRRWADQAGRPLRGDELPPYLAVLCFLVLPGVEREQVNFNYYPELNLLMGRDARAGAPAGFERDVPLLFHRFNDWLRGAGSTHGSPTAKPPPHYPYVGWPLSQALIRPADRLHVQRLFGSLNLRVGQRPKGRQLTQLVVPRLRVAGESSSRTRLLSLHRESPEILDAALAREFDGWGGVATLSGGPASLRLRLCHDETCQEWWFVAPTVDGTGGSPFTIGDRSGSVPEFKGLEVAPTGLWDLVGAGIVGKIEAGPDLVSPPARTRWLSFDRTLGGWAEVARRESTLTQLVLCDVEAAGDLIRRGCRELDGPARSLRLIEAPPGVELGKCTEWATASSRAPRLVGGLRLAATTSTYLWSERCLPEAVGALRVEVEGQSVEVASGSASLRSAVHGPGEYEVVLDDERLRLRVLERLRESWTYDAVDWIDGLPQAVSLVAWGTGHDIWVIGQDGELDHRSAWNDRWLEPLGLASNAVDATGAVQLSAFESAYVVTTFMGKPWVTPVPPEIAGADTEESRRRVDEHASKALLTLLLTSARPAQVAASLRWRKVLAKFLRRVS